MQLKYLVASVAAYAVFINLLSYAVFAWDKHCARNQLWRVSERTILKLASLGGSLGVLLGQRVLRHKTWKEPFGTRLRSIVVRQSVSAIAIGLLIAAGAWSKYH